MISRRRFLRDGLAVATAGAVVPGFLSELARAEGSRSRTLVVLNLAGGNDGLSTVIPYTDSFYYSRRPTIAVPAGQVLQVGTDTGGHALGLHPRLTGLRSVFDQGRLAILQRAGYPNSSRSHFLGTDIWSTANPDVPTGPGWLGRYLDALSSADALTAWTTSSGVPRTLLSSSSNAVSAIPSASAYTLSAVNSGQDAVAARQAVARLATNPAHDRPQLALVNASIQAAMQTLDRVATVATYTGSVAYPNSGLAQALRTVAGAMSRGIGTRIFWVQTGGFDNHSSEGVNETNGTYYGLMATLNDALLAFTTDLGNQGLLADTLLLQFSEFGRRITENGSRGTDHGAASVMLAIGGRVRGGLYGTAPSLNPDPQNPSLENAGGDVRHETDFRSVYARVIDDWLGADSRALLGGDFRSGAPRFL